MTEGRQISTAVNISTASRSEVSTATPMTPPITTSVFEDERPARSVLTLKPLPKIDPKDKGKWGHKKNLTVKETIKDQYRLNKNRKSITVDERARSEEDERLIQKMNKKVAGVHEEKVLEEPDSTQVEVKQEGNKENSDLEKEEHLKTFLKLVPDEEGIIGINEPGKRFTLINWEAKFYHLDRHEQNLEELYNLMMQRFESTTLEGVDLVLWRDLRTMFDANTKDELWQNQER
ncbi:hypothetical protein Tco_0257262 [Tanacetum coccineum]